MSPPFRSVPVVVALLLLLACGVAAQQAIPCLDGALDSQQLPLPSAADLLVVSASDAATASVLVDGDVNTCWTPSSYPSDSTRYINFPLSSNHLRSYYVTGFSLFWSRNTDGEANVVSLINGTASGPVLKTTTWSDGPLHPNDDGTSGVYYFLPDPVVTTSLTLSVYNPDNTLLLCEARMYGLPAIQASSVVDITPTNTGRPASGPISGMLNGLGLSGWQSSYLVNGGFYGDYFTAVSFNLDPYVQYAITSLRIRLKYDGAHCPQAISILRGSNTAQSTAIQAWSVPGWSTNLNGRQPGENGYVDFALTQPLVINGMDTLTLHWWGGQWQVYVGQVVFLGTQFQINTPRPAIGSRSVLVPYKVVNDQNVISCTPQPSLIQKFFLHNNAPAAMWNHTLLMDTAGVEPYFNWWSLDAKVISAANIPTCFPYPYLPADDDDLNTLFDIVQVAPGRQTSNQWTIDNGLTRGWPGTSTYTAEQDIVYTYLESFIGHRQNVQGALKEALHFYREQWTDADFSANQLVSSIFTAAGVAEVHQQLVLLQEAQNQQPDALTIISSVFSVISAVLPIVGAAVTAGEQVGEEAVEAAEKLANKYDSAGTAAGFIGAALSFGPLAASAANPNPLPTAADTMASFYTSYIGSNPCAGLSCITVTASDLDKKVSDMSAQAWDDNTEVAEAVLTNFGLMEMLNGHTNQNRGASQFDDVARQAFKKAAGKHIALWQAFVAVRMFLSTFWVNYYDQRVQSAKLQAFADLHQPCRVRAPLSSQSCGPAVWDQAGAYWADTEQPVNGRYEYTTKGTCVIKPKDVNNFPPYWVQDDGSDSWTALRLIFAAYPFKQNFWLGQAIGYSSAEGSGTSNNCCNRVDPDMVGSDGFSWYMRDCALGYGSRSCFRADDEQLGIFFAKGDDDQGCNQAEVDSLNTGLIPLSMFGQADAAFLEALNSFNTFTSQQPQATIQAESTFCDGRG